MSLTKDGLEFKIKCSTEEVGEETRVMTSRCNWKKGKELVRSDKGRNPGLMNDKGNGPYKKCV